MEASIAGLEAIGLGQRGFAGFIQMFHQGFRRGHAIGVLWAVVHQAGLFKPGFDDAIVDNGGIAP